MTIDEKREEYINFMMATNGRGILDALLQKIGEMPDGYRTSTGRLLSEVFPDAIDAMNVIELFELEEALKKESEKMGIILDKSEHDGRIVGIPYALEFIVRKE